MLTVSQYFFCVLDFWFNPQKCKVYWLVMLCTNIENKKQHHGNITIKPINLRRFEHENLKLQMKFDIIHFTRWKEQINLFLILSQAIRQLITQTCTNCQNALSMRTAWSWLLFLRNEKINGQFPLLVARNVPNSFKHATCLYYLFRPVSWFVTY